MIGFIYLVVLLSCYQLARDVRECSYEDVLMHCTIAERTVITWRSMNRLENVEKYEKSEMAWNSLRHWPRPVSIIHMNIQSLQTSTPAHKVLS